MRGQNIFDNFSHTTAVRFRGVACDPAGRKPGKLYIKQKRKIRKYTAVKSAAGHARRKTRYAEGGLRTINRQSKDKQTASKGHMTDRLIGRRMNRPQRFRRFVGRTRIRHVRHTTARRSGIRSRHARSL